MATEARADSRGRVRRDRALAAGLPLALVVFALGLRVTGLDVPERMYFDEVYYAEDALALLDQGVEEGFAVHPPVGKWLIAAGIAFAGFEPVGWRLAAAVAGGLAVLATYGIGTRLLRRRSLAALGALLVAVDGSALTMSRIAMLDGFVALFVAGAAWLLLIDRDRSHDAAQATVWAHPARWGVGALLGLAVATKWSAVLALAAACLVVVAWDLTRRRQDTGRWLPAPRRLAAGVALPLVVLPALLYLGSYAGWFLNYADTRPGSQVCEAEPCPVPWSQRAADWWHEQEEIARFHTELDADHPYRAPAWTWPVLTSPVVHYYESCGPEEEDCAVAQSHGAIIVGVGNPAVWWLALPAYALLGWAAVVHRRGDAGFLLAFLLGQWVPWLLAARPVFFFYTAPLVPFVALALAWASGEAAGYRRWRWVPAAVGVTAVLVAVYLYPIWVGAELPDTVWRSRMLLRSWY